MLIKDFSGKLPNKLGKRGRLDYRAALLTERFLTMMLKVVTSGRFDKVRKLQTLQSFTDTIQLVNFEKDPTVYALLVAIKNVIKNKLEGATEVEDLMEFVNLELTENFQEIKDSVIFPTMLSSSESTEKEETLVTNTTNICIRYDAIFKNKDELSDILTDIGSGNITNLQNALDNFESVLNTLYEEFKDTKSAGSELRMFHTTDEKEMKENLKEMWDYVHSPKFVLKTGIKRFNQMLSYRGGFLGGQSYIFYADTNNFKSALLRYIAKWIVKYNSNSFMEEFLRTGKRPTIIFVSLEDGSTEDVNRYYSINVQESIDEVSNFEEAWKLWKENYDSIIDITHINGGEHGINFQVLDQILRKIDQDGYFPIALCMDSMDLMSPDPEDIALRINDENVLFSRRAKHMQKWIEEKSFPWITAHQLNRAGNQKIQEMKDAGMTDIARGLGRAYISSSFDVERRVWFSAFIYVEWSKFDNMPYLEIKRDKAKQAKTEIDYIAIPLRNGFYIQDDLNEAFDTAQTSIVPVGDVLNAVQVGTRGAVTMNIDSQKVEEPQTQAFISSSTSEEDTQNIDSTFLTDSSDAAYCWPMMLLQPEYDPWWTLRQGNKTIITEEGWEYIECDDSVGISPFNCN